MRREGGDFNAGEGCDVVGCGGVEGDAEFFGKLWGGHDGAVLIACVEMCGIGMDRGERAGWRRDM